MLAVTALLDLSGPRAALGTVQRDAIQMWLDGRGGSTKTKLRFTDTAGSEAKTILGMRDAVIDQAARAVIVGTPVMYDDTLGRAIEAAAVPVIFTLPLAADPVELTGGRWSFALAPTTGQLASVEMDDAVRHGAPASAVVLTDATETVDPLADALAAAAERAGIPLLTRVVMADGGAVPAPLRSGLPLIAGVHCTAAVSVCAAVARAAADTRADTFFYLPYLTTPADLAEHSELASRSAWPGIRGLLPDPAPVTATGQARAAFLRSFAARHGPAATQAGTAYDAMSLLAAAAARSGPDDPAMLRDALERITMTLIATTYSFGPSRHAGADAGDLIELRWAGGRVLPEAAPRPLAPATAPSASPRPPTSSPSARP